MLKKNQCSVRALILLAAIWATPSFAQNVFRCTVNGKVVLSDQPCADSTALRGSTANLPSAPTAAVPPPAAMQNTSNYSTPYGEWRGQAQYQATDRGQLLQGAHVVVNMAVAIDAAGKVVGSSPDNGCKLLGVAAPFVTPASLSLDVTLSGCQFADYNRRYSGYLHLNQAQKTAALNLNGAFIRAGSFTAYDVRATMRR